MKITLKNIALFAFAALVLAGCKKEDLSEQHYDNKLYISGSKHTDELLVKAGVVAASRDITVSIAKPIDHDINVTLKPAPELLETYRAAYYDADAMVLPEANYTFENGKTQIQAGSIVSTPVTVAFGELSALDRDIRYVLPVTITSVEGIDALQSAKTIYYVFKGAALINVVADIAGMRVYPKWNNPLPMRNMRRFTLEALINGTKFTGKEISTIMGIEGKFLIRCGDAGLPSNQIQISSSRNNTSSQLQLEVGRWYHLAVTFDNGNIKAYLNGEEKLSGSAGTTSVDLGVAHSDESNGQARCCWIGYSYNDDRDFNGRIAEVRIWNKPLTTAEINAPAHFYTVDPASDGLVAYWKFDEGTGMAIKDHSQYGNALTCTKLPKWISVSLPEKSK